MNRRIIPGLLICPAFLLLLGFGGGHATTGRTGHPTKMSVASAVSGDVAAGRAVFQGTCAMCHGPSGRGIQNFGKDLVNPSDWMKRQSDADLAAFIKQGREATDPLNTTGYPMLPLGGNPNLTDHDVVNVVAYIRSLQKAK